MSEHRATRPPTTVVRAGPAALVVGGLLSLVFHVLYEVGHGPTVVNEHGVVLGLTNDQWSYVSVVWMALVGVGLAALRALDPGRAVRRATTVTLLGLAVRSVASWVWLLYVPGELLLIAGRGLVGASALRRRTLPAWSVVPLLVAMAGWVVFAVASDAVYAASVTVWGIAVRGNDVLAALSALGWVGLGAGLHVVVRSEGAPAPRPVAPTGRGLAVARGR